MKYPHPVLSVLFALLVGAALAQTSYAQGRLDRDTPAPESPPSSQQFGPDTVYFNVLNTGFLTPEVARSYGITRGKDKFLVNVSVRNSETGAIAATVTGSSSDLIHRHPLVFREIVEQDAIYYIAELDIDGKRETRDFRLSVTTATRPQPYDIQFTKTLHIEN